MSASKTIIYRKGERISKGGILISFRRSHHMQTRVVKIQLRRPPHMSKVLPHCRPKSRWMCVTILHTEGTRLAHLYSRDLALHLHNHLCFPTPRRENHLSGVALHIQSLLLRQVLLTAIPSFLTSDAPNLTNALDPQHPETSRSKPIDFIALLRGNPGARTTATRTFRISGICPIIDILNTHG